VVQLVECLPSKCEALSSNHSITKSKQKSHSERIKKELGWVLAHTCDPSYLRLRLGGSLLQASLSRKFERPHLNK
jgi:hypothetical protein